MPESSATGTDEWQWGVREWAGLGWAGLGWVRAVA